MTSKHTPGPWEAGTNPKPNAGHSNVWVVRPQGEFPHGLWVADVGRLCEEAEANARLIAAAPELLEALRAFTDSSTVRASKSYTDLGKARTLARAAIAKATEGDA